MVSGARAGKNEIIFRRGVYVAGKSFSRSDVQKRASPTGLARFCTQAQCNASPAMPEGHCAIVPPRGTGQGESKGGTKSPL